MVSLFDRIYDKINLQLEVESDWMDREGDYLPLAEKELGLPPGSRFRAIDIFDRRVIGVVTPVGNLVFYEKNEGGHDDVIVKSVPLMLRGLIPEGLATEEQILFVGTREYDSNIGVVLERVNAHY